MKAPEQCHPCCTDIQIGYDSQDLILHTRPRTDFEQHQSHILSAIFPSQSTSQNLSLQSNQMSKMDKGADKCVKWYKWMFFLGFLFPPCWLLGTLYCCVTPSRRELKLIYGKNAYEWQRLCRLAATSFLILALIAGLIIAIVTSPPRHTGHVKLKNHAKYHIKYPFRHHPSQHSFYKLRKKM